MADKPAPNRFEADQVTPLDPADAPDPGADRTYFRVTIRDDDPVPVWISQTLATQDPPKDEEWVAERLNRKVAMSDMAGVVEVLRAVEGGYPLS